MKQLLILLLLFEFLTFNSCTDSGKTRVHDQNKVRVSGVIEGLSDTTLTFSYTPYVFLADDSVSSFEVDSSGQFSFQLEENEPLKGFLSFGKVPRTYRFEYQTIAGKDTIGIVPSVDFRMIWLYFEPGDSIFLRVDANDIENTLVLSGKGSNNSDFINREEFLFNDYKSKYLNNYYYKTFLKPNEYKKVTQDLMKTKLEFMKNFQKDHDLSPFLQKLYKESNRAQMYSSWMYYPGSHAGFNNGKYPELPPDYYDFLNDISPAEDFHKLGASYLSFLNAWMGRMFEQDYPNGADPEVEYQYILDQLPDESGYRLLAYKLPRDFNATLYQLTTRACPYENIAKLVTKKYSHLEAMFPGSEVPAVIFKDVNDQPVQLSDFKGKLLFLDFWATWCKPCIKEFPFLDEIKKKFADEEIIFIGISVDRAADVEAWKTYVEEHQLTGVQIHAPREAYEPMKKAWNISSIPRFVVIRPDGKMEDARAPRPSDPDLVEYLSQLLQ